MESVGDIATVLGLDATTLYEIFDMVITVAPVENPSYEYSVAIKDLALALADYLDHIDEDGFNLYTFTNLVNTKLTVFNDAYNAYLGNGGQQIEGFEVFGILQMITTVDPSITEAEFTYKVLLNNVVSMFTPMINEGLTNIGATEDEIETINTLINDIINDTSSVNLQRFAELAKIMLQFADEDIFGNAGYYELDPNSPNSNIFVSITDDNVSEIIMNMFRNILTYLETEEQPTQKGILDIMHATFVEVEAEMNRVNENLLQNNHGDYYTWKLYTVDLLNHLTDTNLSTVDQLKQFAKGYAIELSRLIAMSLQETLGVKEENLNNLYQFVNNNVNSYLDNNFELPYFLMNMMQFINQNCDEDHKTVFNTVATYYIIKNYDSLVQAFPEGTDMDAIFESFMDLELPDGITDIDYNKLVSQLQDPENWMNKLVIEEVETQHVLDQNGLMKEVIVFNVSTNLDIGLEEVDLSVVKLLSNFQITVELTM